MKANFQGFWRKEIFNIGLGIFFTEGILSSLSEWNTSSKILFFSFILDLYYAIS